MIRCLIVGPVDQDDDAAAARHSCCHGTRAIRFGKGPAGQANARQNGGPTGAILHCRSPRTDRNRERRRQASAAHQVDPPARLAPMSGTQLFPGGGGRRVGDRERIPAPRRRARMADASDRRTARTCGRASSSSGSCHDIQGSKSVCGTIHKCCEMIHDPFRFYFCSELISSLMLVRLA